ncbi:S-layer homology domain-containing protein [Anaerocolumna sp. AGMB13020]|uniref:YcdB/YcdC domain-containing protein n=1 Tax=Anaerocolumna sp. AGMB13020 TaxID=3081750 RepID=UPI002953BBDC|nr:YcdB/YcdC domain-containing protein [Anaerocolumna sp. AGMB13020]WOO37301.1 S-layer homology domain-containing protein [Anaerocolumna sp. AGMB13020]
MISKKIGTVILTSALIVSTLPTPFLKADASSLASNNTIEMIATKAAAGVDTEATASSAELEKMITAVKSKITVPSELSNFSYNYYSGSGNSYVWNLSWSNKDGSKTINVNCDSKGRISNYSFNTDKSYKPVYLQEELKTKADTFIKSIASDIAGKLQYTETSSASSYDGTYTYEYQRVENGIPMPDNTVSVAVNYQTGEVTNYSVNWLYDVSIPGSTVKITKEDAAAKIGKNIKMTLSYQSAYVKNADGKSSSVKAFLVYSPDNSYIAVDAVSGKVYTTQNQWLSDSLNQATAETSAKDASSGFTPEEINEIDSIKGLITKTNAINAVKNNTKLLFDKNMTSVNANLYKRNSDSSDASYVWNINFADPREAKEGSKDTYRAYAYAVVDAKTGKIISYHSSTKNYYSSAKEQWESVNVKYTQKQGKATLESFIKEQVPDYFKNTEYTGSSEDYVIAYKDSKPVYGGYSYNYQRVNEGIAYAANNINGAVDGVTGKVYSFGYNWDKNITFEAPKNIISADKAFTNYIANEGYRLIYEVYYENSISTAKNTTASDAVYTQTPSVRLVYRTDITPEYFSPFTGKQLDYEGKEYVKPTGLYTYTDIDGNSSARNIKLLANMGIGFDGGLYKPTQAITAEELINFIEKANFYYNSSKYKLTGSTVSRLNAAKFAVQLLGLEKAAAIPGIYSVNISDQASISQSDMGYAAIAYGLKILLPGSDNKLRPGDSLTRQDAADLVVAMLNSME